VSPSKGWALHFKDLFQQKRYKVVGFKGDWALRGTFDNRHSKATQSFSVKQTTGYSHTQSTTITDTWSAKMGFVLKNIGGSVSFTHAVQHYDSSTFSTSVTKTHSVNCPANTLCNYRQRLLTATFALQSAPSLEIDGDKGPEQVYIHGSQFRFNNPYGGSQCQCDDNGLTKVTITWAANCFSTNPDPTQRDQACPAGGPSVLLGKSEETVV
jgi:hypothetical protein